MLIVIDGPRGSGKTTLVNGVVEKLQEYEVPVMKFKSERPADPFEQMKDAIDYFRSRSDLVWVADRFSLTEFVMSTALERINPIYLGKKMDEIHKYMAANIVSTTFVLFASNAVLDRRIKQREKGRRWDMEKKAVTPLWRAAISLAIPHINVIPRENNFNDDLEFNIQEILTTIQYLEKTHVS